MARYRFVLGALSVLWAQALGSAGAAPLGATIDPGLLGSPTFEETWSTFAAAPDQKRKTGGNRWRMVFGSGGELSFDNRKGSASSVYVDPQFPGVEDGKLGSQSLGLNPFEWSPGAPLAIVARPTPPELKSKLFGASYYSGVLTTKFSFTQLFGYFEVEAKLPTGKGLWPTFWLMPIVGVWPQNGELDVFEQLGASRVIYTTVHSGAQKEVQKEVALPFDVDKDWHTYGAAWTSDEIVWYVDRKEVFRAPTPSDMKTTPMYLLINMAVGGPWGGQPDKTTAFPARYLVKRVSAWKLP